MKDIIITGGAGFIGSHLVEHLSKENNIIVIDNLSTGHLENLSNIIKDIQFINEDIESFDFTTIENVDLVVHLAAQTSVPLSIVEFKKSSNQNILSSINIIDYCCNNNIPLVYASSSAVYGELTIGDDSNKKVDLVSPYAVDKFAMENYLEMAYKLYGLPSIGLRFFNVFGPRQDPKNPYSGVISIFLDRIVSGKSIQVNGGYQTRDFIYVADVVKALNNSIELVASLSICEVINVLSGKSYSINKLVEILSKLLNVEPKIVRKELPKGDCEKSEGTIKKMHKILNLNPENNIDFESGLIQMIENLD